MIEAAPVSFVCAVVACLLVCFLIVRAMYKESLETTKENLVAAKDALALHKEKSSLSKLSPERLESMKRAWLAAPKQNVVGKRFVNETVPLDGYTYINCEFRNVTLVFNGDASFGLINSQFFGYRFQVNDPGTAGFLLLLQAAGLLAVPLLNVDVQQPPK